MTGAAGLIGCARVLLAAVFAVAAAGKALDQAGARRAVTDFGLPAEFAPLAARMLPALEAAVAATLMVSAVARAGAAGALLLLVVFTGAMLAALARGEAPTCHCFGAVAAHPVGWGAVARNLGLALAAVAVLAAGGRPALAAWGSVVAVAALAAGAVLWVRTAGRGGAGSASLGAVATPPTPLRVGSRAPALGVVDVSGRRVSLRSLVAGSRSAALVFVSPGCGACETLLPELARWRVPLARELPIHVVCSGPPERAREVAATHALGAPLIDADRALSRRYGLAGTPAALIVDGRGRVASSLAVGPGAVEALLRVTLRGA